MVQILASMYLAAMITYIGVVFFFSSRPEGFHGLVPMDKQLILNLRTGFAALSIFLFFPIILVINRRGNAYDSPSGQGLTMLASTLAECPAVFGLILFLLRGAYKTFFAFLALSAFYTLIAWPRSSRSEP